MTDAPSLRMQIHTYIREHPAAHILEIAQAFDLTHPTVMYHLGLLADEGYIVSSIWGKRRVHFDTAAHYTAWEREILALVAVGEARSILDFISARPGTFPREIAHELGVSDTTVKRYVPELLRLAVIAEAEGTFRRRLSVARSFGKRAIALLEKMPPASTAASRLSAVVPGGFQPAAVATPAPSAETRDIYR